MRDNVVGCAIVLCFVSLIFMAYETLGLGQPPSQSSANVTAVKVVKVTDCDTAPVKTASKQKKEGPSRLDGVHTNARIDPAIPYIPQEIPIAWPTESTRVTGEFKEKRRYETHLGLDIGAPLGAPISSPGSGLVLEAKHNPKAKIGWGGTIVIDYGVIPSLGKKLAMRFSHCSKVFAKKGERVLPGQVVALIGSSGRSSGPHLDWRCYINSRPADPRICMAALAP